MQHVSEDLGYQLLYTQQVEENQQIRFQLNALQQQLSQLKKLIYGSRQERFIPTDNNPSQLTLSIESQAAVACNIIDTQKISYTRYTATVSEIKKDHPGRTKLPDHLERRIIAIEPGEDVTGFKKIGEEITEELEYEPGNLFVNRYVRSKYAKPNNEGIVIAPMIDRPLPKAIAGPGLLSQIVIDKYVDHLPLYRQMERFKRQGVTIPYSTITDMISGTCKLLTPLFDALVKIMLQSNYLHADETPIKVLDKDKKGDASAGSAHRGYFWVYHNSIEGLVVFDYRQGRGREGPAEILKNFTGHLQTDGYAVYDVFKDKEDITVMHCMAHARRMFFEAQANDHVRASYAMEQIQNLYTLEGKAKELGLNEAEILQLRIKESIPVLQSLGKWMKEQYLQTLPKSVIGKALGYSIERWNELMVYTTDGKLNIDNNPVENSIRPVALGRKNYLFAGSHEAAQRSAMLYSFMGTCKLNKINPAVWLTDVLKRINNHPINKITELLPQNWKPVL